LFFFVAAFFDMRVPSGVSAACGASLAALHRASDSFFRRRYAQANPQQMRKRIFWLLHE
jgi:hypothetical protein